MRDRNAKKMFALFLLKWERKLRAYRAGRTLFIGSSSTCPSLVHFQNHKCKLTLLSFFGQVFRRQAKLSFQLLESTACRVAQRAILVV
jgi:hypothetical protein